MRRPDKDMVWVRDKCTISAEQLGSKSTQFDHVVAWRLLPEQIWRAAELFFRGWINAIEPKIYEQFQTYDMEYEPRSCEFQAS